MVTKFVRFITFLALMAAIGVGGYFTVKALPGSQPDTAAAPGQPQPALEKKAVGNDNPVIDIGSGYQLEQRGQDWELVQAYKDAAVAAPRAAGADPQAIELGSGYRLLKSGEGWVFVEPVTQSMQRWAQLPRDPIANAALIAASLAPRSEPDVDRIDLGSGYELVKENGAWNMVNTLAVPASAAFSTVNTQATGPEQVNSILGWEAVAPTNRTCTAEPTYIDIGSGLILKCANCACELVTTP